MIQSPKDSSRVRTLRIPSHSIVRRRSARPEIIRWVQLFPARAPHETSPRPNVRDVVWSRYMFRNQAFFNISSASRHTSHASHSPFVRVIGQTTWYPFYAYNSWSIVFHSVTVTQCHGSRFHYESCKPSDATWASRTRCRRPGLHLQRIRTDQLYELERREAC